MLDVTAPHEPAATVTEAQRPSLLDAALKLAATMRHAGVSLTVTADRMRSYDAQPYPCPYAFSSNVVIEFLYALDAARQARLDGEAVLEAQVGAPRPVYGPRLRETL